MHTGAQRKFVSRADRHPAWRVGKKGVPLLDLYAQGRIGKLAAKAACAPRGGDVPLLDCMIQISKWKGVAVSK